MERQGKDAGGRPLAGAPKRITMARIMVDPLRRPLLSCTDGCPCRSNAALLASTLADGKRKLRLRSYLEPRGRWHAPGVLGLPWPFAPHPGASNRRMGIEIVMRIPITL